MRSGVCLLLFFFLVVAFLLGDCNKNCQVNFVSCLQHDEVHPWHKFYIAGTESTIKGRFGKDSSLSLSKTNVDNVTFLTA